MQHVRIIEGAANGLSGAAGVPGPWRSNTRSWTVPGNLKVVRCREGKEKCEKDLDAVLDEEMRVFKKNIENWIRHNSKMIDPNHPPGGPPSETDLWKDRYNPFPATPKKEPAGTIPK